MPEAQIKEVELLRLRSKKNAAKGLFCFAVFCGALYRIHHYSNLGQIAMMTGWGVSATFSAMASIAYFGLTRHQFVTAWARFYHRRCQHAVEILLQEGYDFERFGRKRLYSKWAFWRAKDLKRFEESWLEYLHSYRRAEDLFRHQRKWERANSRLETQFVGILAEFGVEGKERDEIMKGFSSYSNPRRRREYIQGICSRLTYKRWRPVQPTPAYDWGTLSIPARSVATEDIELRSLELQASKVVSVAAKRYYAQGLEATLRRDRLRFFGRAISEDIRDAEQEVEAERPKKNGPDTPVSRLEAAEVKHISLQSFARDRLAVMQSLVVEANWKMCREIVLALAEPGRSGGRFNKHYYAEDTVKRMVRRQCDLYADIPFDPGVFEQATSLLLREGVVVTKPKTDERTLSLSSHVKGAVTPEAGEIIAAVLRVKREMSGLPI